MDVASEFAALKEMHPAAVLHTEGSKPVILLPATKFRAGGAAMQMNLLLYPSAHSGYATRLFFERKILGTAQNWTDGNWSQHTVLSGSWWTPSWKDVSPEQPWTSMLMAHLRSVA